MTTSASSPSARHRESLGGITETELNALGKIMTRQQIRERRKRRGLCLTCVAEPTKCFEIKKHMLNPLREDRKPLTVEGEVYQGICLRCYPAMDPRRKLEREEQRKKKARRKRKAKLAAAAAVVAEASKMKPSPGGDLDVNDETGVSDDGDYLSSVNGTTPSESSIPKSSMTTTKISKSRHTPTMRDDDIRTNKMGEKLDATSLDDMISTALSTETFYSDPNSPDKDGINAEQKSDQIPNRNPSSDDVSHRSMMEQEKEEEQGEKEEQEETEEEESGEDKFASASSLLHDTGTSVTELQSLIDQLLDNDGDETAIDILSNAMMESPEDLTLQEYGITTLWTLSRLSEENKEAIVYSSALDTIVRAMEQNLSSRSVQERGCGVLWSLALVGRYRSYIATSGGCSRIITALGEYINHETVVYMAIGALRVLSNNDVSSAALKRIGGRAVEAIAIAMTVHRSSSRIQREGCALLSNMAVDVVNHCVADASKEEIEVIFQAMEAHPNSAVVQKNACFALKNYSFCAGNVAILKEYSRAETLLKQASENFGIQCEENANIVLSRLKLPGNREEEFIDIDTLRGPTRQKTFASSAEREEWLKKAGEKLSKPWTHDSNDKIDDSERIWGTIAERTARTSKVDERAAVTQAPATKVVENEEKKSPEVLYPKALVREEEDDRPQRTAADNLLTSNSSRLEAIEAQEMRNCAAETATKEEVENERSITEMELQQNKATSDFSASLVGASSDTDTDSRSPLGAVPSQVAQEEQQSKLIQSNNMDNGSVGAPIIPETTDGQKMIVNSIEVPDNVEVGRIQSPLSEDAGSVVDKHGESDVLSRRSIDMDKERSRKELSGRDLLVSSTSIATTDNDMKDTGEDVSTLKSLPTRESPQVRAEQKLADVEFTPPRVSKTPTVDGYVDVKIESTAVAPGEKVETEGTSEEGTASKTTAFRDEIRSCARYVSSVNRHSPESKASNRVSLGRKSLQWDDRNEYSLGVALLSAKEKDPRKMTNNVSKAAEHLQNAFATRVRVLGPDHIEVAVVQEKLGDAERKLGNSHKAEEHYRDALRILELQQCDEGNCDAPRINTMLIRVHASLGHALFDSGRIDKATELYERSMRGYIRETEDGTVLFLTRDEVTRIKVNMGKAYLKKDDVSKALDLLTDALTEKQMDKPYEEWDEEVATIFHNIGLVHERTGDYDAAMDNFTQALKLESKLFDPSYELFLETTSHVGFVLFENREYDAAMMCFNKVADQLKLKKIEQQKDLVMLEEVLGKMALIYKCWKETDRAVECHQEIISVMRTRLGERSAQVAEEMVKLGKLLVKLGYLESAMEHYEEALEVQKQIFGAEHHKVAATLNKIGALLCKMKAFNHALKYCTEALRISRLEPLDRNEEVFALNILGLICSSQSRDKHAIKCYEEALHAQKLNPDNGDSQTSVTLQNLADAYFRSGNIDEAIIHYEEALAIDSKGDHTSNEKLSFTLGKLYKERGNKTHNVKERNRLFHEAIKHYDKALESQMRTRRKDAVRMFSILSSLGDLHTYLESYDKSIDCYESAIKSVETSKRNFDGDLDEVVGILSKAGSSCMELEYFDKALVFYEKALVFCRRGTNGKHCDIPELFHKCGDINIQLKHYDAAVSDFEEALSFIPRDKVSQRLTIGHRFLTTRGLIHLERKEYDSAKASFLSALRIMQDNDIEHDHPYMIEIRRNIAEIDRVLNRSFFGWVHRDDG